MSYIQKAGKNSAWRRNNLNNLVADVILYEKIETSLPTAKSLTKLLAKLISWAKKNTLHSRRLALCHLVNKKHLKNQGKNLIEKLFDLGSKYQTRPGGYSRIIRLGLRNGDNNMRVILSLV